MQLVKRIRTILLSKYSILLSLILGLFGILQYSCTKYGTPSAKFRVAGTIKSDSTGNNIQNISVIGDQYDTVFSDANGFYQIQTGGFPLDTVMIQIKFSDIDGTQNGSFQDIDTVVEFDNPQFNAGDGDWYAGETNKVFNIKLKPKN
jgi:putative lipoprotein (rSAM/lipoprotein system)